MSGHPAMDRNSRGHVSQPTFDPAFSTIAFGPRTLHCSDDGRIDDQATEGCDCSHVQPGEPMHGPHEDPQVGQVAFRYWPDRERREGVYGRVAQLAQLLVLEPIQEAKVSVRCPWSDQGLGAIRRAETIRVGFRVPSRTLVIPPEQAADAAPQPEEPLDHRRRRRAPRDHDSPQVLDRTAGAATREGNRPRVLQRDVVQQCVHAKGACAKFVGVDAHRRLAQPARLRSCRIQTVAFLEQLQGLLYVIWLFDEPLRVPLLTRYTEEVATVDVNGAGQTPDRVCHGMNDVVAQGEGVTFAQRFRTRSFDSATSLTPQPAPQDVVLAARVDRDDGPHLVIVGHDGHPWPPDDVEDGDIRRAVERLDLGAVWLSERLQNRSGIFDRPG